MTSSNPVILVVDELPAVVRLLELELGFQGFRTVDVLLPDDAVAAAMEVRPQAIVLGSAVPTPAIYNILVELKQMQNAPVLFVHSGGSESDAALALQFGADDTIARPYTPEDLSLRLRALLQVEVAQSQMFRRGRFTIDVMHRIVWRDGMKLALGTSEWALMLALVQHDRVVPAEELLRTAWGDDYANELRFLSQWIAILRKNLGDDLESPEVITGDLQSGFEFVG